MRRLTILFALLPVASFAATPVEMTQEEFKMFRQWQKAMKDPRVEKIKPERRNAAIAKDARFKLKDMEKAIEKGEAAGDLKATCEANIKEALGTGAIAGRLGTVEVDTSDPHAVAYVQWHNENPAQLEEEASLIAAHAAKQCPVTSTIQLWAQDKANPKTRVFQALISRSAAAKINAERAKDFADTRYIRLFEGVKNVAQGDVLDDNARPGATEAAPTGGTAGGQK